MVQRQGQALPGQVKLKLCPSPAVGKGSGSVYVQLSTF